MPFLGRSGGAGKPNVLLDAITTSATATYNLTKDSAAYFPTGATSLIVSLNGVTQAPVTGFTVNGSAITFDSALASTDVVDYIVGHDSVVKTLAVSDASITTSKIADGAITAAKFAANSVDSDQYVDGSVDLVHLSANSVDIAKLNVTDGTAGQFLKTDGNNVLSFGTVAAPVLSYNAWLIKTANFTAVNGSQIMVTGSSAITITLPAGVEGHSVSIRNNSSATVTVARNGSDKINSTADNGEIAAAAGSQLVFANSTLGWMEV